MRIAQFSAGAEAMAGDQMETRTSNRAAFVPLVWLFSGSQARAGLALSIIIVGLVIPVRYAISVAAGVAKDRP
jgi:hypothetical protein